MLVRRYRLFGPLKAKIDSQMDPAWQVFPAGANPVYKDLQFAPAGATGPTGGTGPTGPPENAIQDVDQIMADFGFQYVEDNPSVPPCQICILQDFAVQLPSDVSTSAQSPNWGDLFVVPVSISGHGENRLKAICTASLKADGNAAVLRMILRPVGGGPALNLSHVGYVFSSAASVYGSTSVSGTLTELVEGDYELVLQGQVGGGSISIQPVTDPDRQGANISIQEICE